MDPDKTGWDSTPEELMARIDTLGGLFAKAPALTSDVSVARGIVATSAFDPSSLEVGSFFADPAFYSSTTDLQEALGFSSGDPGLASRGIEGQGWKIISEAPEGTRVLPGAGYQHELVFPSGTTQQVLKVDSENHILYTRMVTK